MEDIKTETIGNKSLSHIDGVIMKLADVEGHFERVDNSYRIDHRVDLQGRNRMVDINTIGLVEDNKGNIHEIQYTITIQTNEKIEGEDKL